MTALVLGLLALMLWLMVRPLNRAYERTMESPKGLSVRGDILAALSITIPVFAAVLTAASLYMTFLLITS